MQKIYDNSEVVLFFTEQILEMIITSPKRKRTIKRTLQLIDFEKQDIPMHTLNNIVQPYTFEMTKDDFGDLMNNSGYYSEILEINVNPKRVLFKESSSEGSSEIDYKKKNLVNLTFNEKALQKELNQCESESSKQAIKKILDEKVSNSSYSLSFLKVVKNFCVINDLQDKITFLIKTDTPLKVQTLFKKLNKTTLTYYLAPRAPEEDFEEDYDDFEPSNEEKELEDDFEPTIDEDEVTKTEEK